MTYTFQVQNIHCQSCVRLIKGELLDVHQLNHVEVDIEKQEVHIHEEISEKNILATLESIGFPEKKDAQIV